jgi:hypothetical protein
LEREKIRGMLRQLGGLEGRCPYFHCPYSYNILCRRCCPRHRHGRSQVRLFHLVLLFLNVLPHVVYLHPTPSSLQLVPNLSGPKSHPYSRIPPHPLSLQYYPQCSGTLDGVHNSNNVGDWRTIEVSLNGDVVLWLNVDVGRGIGIG